MKAGLIDEVSLLLAPAIDGASGTPALFDVDGADGDSMGARLRLSRTACKPLADGTVWLRYRVAPAG